jgi:hypothetical protein
VGAQPRRPGRQLLTGELGRAWTADKVTDAELAACDQLLAAWRHPAWPSRLDCPAWPGSATAAAASAPSPPGSSTTSPPASTPRQRTRRRRAATATPAPPRPARAILQVLADDQLTALHFPVRPVPYTGWHEWQWTRDLIRERTPAPAAGASPNSAQAGHDVAMEGL